MESFRNFWHVWGPWISLSLIPTIITGLSVSPKTSKAVPFIQKAWDALKSFLDMFSVATFKDKPGTFQLPLKAYKLFEKKTPPTAPTAIILILALSIPGAGCCKLFGDCGTGVKQDIIDCTSQAALTNAPQLLPIVKDILTGKTDGWAGRIWDLIKEFGRDAVACAMQQVGQDLLASVPPGGGTPTPEQATALEGADRARQFTAEQKWQFKPAAK
jgi:hypothetical protein